jgi:uncharacterized membrane protein
MNAPTDSTPHRRSFGQSIVHAVGKVIRTRLTAGLITVLPIVVTLWLVRLVFDMVRSSSQWAVEAYLRSMWGLPLLDRWHFDFDHWRDICDARAKLGLPLDSETFMAMLPANVQWGVPLVSVLVTIFMLYLIGLVAANFLGRRFIGLVEAIVERVPLVKTVYRAVKQILSSFGGDQAQNYQRVVLAAFPDVHMRAVGFLTSTFKDTITGEELAAVFIATTPNPTTGFLQIIRRSELTELDWSVEEAARTIMSGGILAPGRVTMLQNRDLAAQSADKPAT